MRPILNASLFFRQREACAHHGTGFLAQRVYNNENQRWVYAVRSEQWFLRQPVGTVRHHADQ